MADDSFEVMLAEEKAVAHVQAMVFRLMGAKKITRSQLAELMGVSQAHVSQLLGDEPQNLSVRKVARLLHALGEELEISCLGIDELDRAASARNKIVQACLQRSSMFAWRGCANGNDLSDGNGRNLVAA